MMRRASVPLAATFSLLAGCVDGPVLLDEAPDAGGPASDDVDGGTGVIYSNPLNSSTYRWPNAEIPFRFSGSGWDVPNDANRNAVRAQMHLWEDLTRVTFIESAGCS